MAEIMTLTPQWVNEPKPGKKWASISVNKVYYSFDPAKIPMSSFQKNVPVTIEYTTSEQGYNNIVRVVPGAQPAAQVGAGGTGGGSYRQAMDPVESRKITKLAIAKSCIEGNQTIQVAEMWLEWCSKP